MKNCDVAIIGAGPYGLSVAAHLKLAGVDFRIFGSPMEFWLKHMPQGMHLKSEGFASSLFDPGSDFTLEAYCKEKGLPYSSLGSPVPLEVFTSYGVEFQKRYVPNLEHQKVAKLRKSFEGFQLTLDDGEVFTARRVVVAVGLTYFDYLPPELASLPGELVTHSSRHSALEQFRGKDVAIVGAGASALDLAALLHQVGASVQVLVRGPKVRFHDRQDNVTPSLLDRLRNPITGIGPGWKLYLCTNMPLVFRLMPEKFRLDKVRRILGPAPCWFTKEHVIGKVGINLGVRIAAANAYHNRITLRLSDDTGAERTLEADHLIAATGYRVDLQRLAFIDADLLSQIRSVDKAPALSANFESSIRDLYFVGITAANTFGPLLRFAFGAGFAAPRISKHLARTAARTLAVRKHQAEMQPVTERDTAEPVTH